MPLLYHFWPGLARGGWRWPIEEHVNELSEDYKGFEGIIEKIASDVDSMNGCYRRIDAQERGM